MWIKYPSGWRGCKLYGKIKNIEINILSPKDIMYLFYEHGKVVSKNEINMVEKWIYM